MSTGRKFRSLPRWISPVFKTATAYLQGQQIEADSAPVYTTHLTGADKKIFLKGAEVFNREGHCITCHQSDGKGLPAAQFPPLPKASGSRAARSASSS